MKEVDDKCSISHATDILRPDCVAGGRDEFDGEQTEKQQHGAAYGGGIGKHRGSANLLPEQSKRVRQIRYPGKDGCRLEWHTAFICKSSKRRNCEPEGERCERDSAGSPAPNVMIGVVHPTSQPPERQQEQNLRAHEQ